MKTVEYCICDGCNKPIIDEFDGLIIHGGIYTADPKKNGGLIGNCFEPDKNGMVEYNKIAETVLCIKCFEQTINKVKKKIHWENKNLDRWQMNYENKNLDGVKFFGQPVQNMNADNLLKVVGYLLEENQRLKDRAKRRMEIMTLKPVKS